MSGRRRPAGRPPRFARPGTRWVLALAVGIAILGAPRAARPEDALMVAAAMSLRRVMPPLAQAFRAQDDGPEIRIGYAASGNLRRQVEGGAPIDTVIFADTVSVDALIASGYADGATRRVVATNTLVLIGGTDTRPLTFATLGELPADALLAIGEPGAVPAGRYARTALRNLGVWNALQGRIVFAGHVGAVLSYARRGEVAAAIVYGTEARGVPDVRVLDHAVKPWAPEPEIVAAVTTESAQPARSRALLAFLETREARRILLAHGFGIPGARAPRAGASTDPQARADEPASAERARATARRRASSDSRNSIRKYAK